MVANGRQNRFRLKEALTMPEGLDDRYRDENGRIHEKRGDTEIATLRDIYGPDFAAGHRGDMRLDTLLDQTGQPSLSAYLRSQQKGK
jgi:hypothetical protein